MRKLKTTIAGLGFLILGITIASVVMGVTALYNSTVRIVDSAGNVIGGVASAVTANYNSTVRVVDSTGHVLDSFGGGGATSTPTATVVGGTPTPSPTPTPVPNGIGGNAPSVAGKDSVINIKNYGAKGDGVILADGEMPSGAYTASGSAVDPGGFILDFRGVNTTTPVDVSANTNNAGSSTSAVAPSVTTTVNNDYLVNAFIGTNGGTFTPTNGSTLGAYQIGVGGTNYSAASQVTALGAAGATGTFTATWGTAQAYGARSIALQPANGQTITFIGGMAGVNPSSGGANSNSVPEVPGALAGDVVLACWSYTGTLTPPVVGTKVGTTGTGATGKLDCYTWTTTVPGNTLTSNSATFTAGDVGKLICVDKTSLTSQSSTSVDTCGAIVGFTDSHDVVLSIPNGQVVAIGQPVTITAATESTNTATFTTGARSPEVMVGGQQVHITGVTPAGYNGDWIIASVPGNTSFTAALTTAGLGPGTVFGTAQPAIEFRYATNDDTAIANAAAAACGKELFFPTGLYGKTTTLAPCSTAGVLIQGSGAGLATYFGSARTYVGGQPSTALLYLTKGMTGAGISLGSGLGAILDDSNRTYRNTTTIRDISVLAGAGEHWDGGSSTSDGILSNLAGHLILDDVMVTNFGGNCLNLTFPTNGFLAIADITNGLFDDCGLDGIKVAAIQQFNLQSTDVSRNQRHGVDLGGVSGATILNNILQWNNVAGALNPGYQFISTGNSGLLQGNWFEDIYSGAHTYSFNVTSVGFLAFNNHFNIGSGSTNAYYAHFTAGNDAACTASGNPYSYCTAASTGTNAIPAAGTGNYHMTACVVDSTACTNGTTYTTGGSTTCTVQSNGTNWIETGQGCF